MRIVTGDGGAVGVWMLQITPFIREVPSSDFFIVTFTILHNDVDKLASVLSGKSVQFFSSVSD